MKDTDPKQDPYHNNLFSILESGSVINNLGSGTLLIADPNPLKPFQFGSGNETFCTDQCSGPDPPGSEIIWPQGSGPFPSSHQS